MINPVLQTLRSGQPVFYESTFDLSVDNARKLVNDGYDIIRANTEHKPLNLSELEAFCRAVRKFSSTERRTIVMVETPFRGVSEAVVEANSWVVDHLLNAGAESIILCQAVSVAAIESFVRCCTLGFQAFPDGTRGYRGYGSQVVSSEALGVQVPDYLKYGNPTSFFGGGLWLGVKLESKVCATICDDLHSVAGIDFSEWGPGDMGQSLGYPDAHDPPYPKSMVEIQKTICDSALKNGKTFLNQCSEHDYKFWVDAGVRIFKPTNVDVMNKTRAYCKYR